MKAIRAAWKQSRVIEVIAFFVISVEVSLLCPHNNGYFLNSNACWSREMLVWAQTLHLPDHGDHSDMLRGSHHCRSCYWSCRSWSKYSIQNKIILERRYFTSSQLVWNGIVSLYFVCFAVVLFQTTLSLFRLPYCWTLCKVLGWLNCQITSPHCQLKHFSYSGDS